jgi:hypothetical protein
MRLILALFCIASRPAFPDADALAEYCSVAAARLIGPSKTQPAPRLVEKALPPAQRSLSQQAFSLHDDLVLGRPLSVKPSQEMLVHLVKNDPRLALEIAGLLRARDALTGSFAIADTHSLPVQYQSPGFTPAHNMIHHYSRFLNQAQRSFDLEGTLTETLNAIRRDVAAGRTFSASQFEAFWPSHGAAHGINIAADAGKIAKQMHDTFGKSDPAGESYAAFLGLVHDMGMHAGGKQVRTDHAHMAPFLGLGGKVKGLETASENVEAFVRKFSADEHDPLAIQIRHAAASPYFTKLHPNLSPQQRRELLTREMFVGTLSHENGGDQYDPKLGPQHLGTTRNAAIALLGKTRILGADQESYANAIHNRYGPEFEKKFLTWLVASPEELAANPEISALRETFWKGECFLNFADPGRVSGMGKTNGVGTTQSVVVETAQGVKLNQAVADPVTGEKVLIDSDSSRLGRYVLESSGSRAEQGVVRNRVSLSPLRLIVPEHYKEVLDDAARVAGQTAGYRARGLAPLIGHSIATDLHIPAEIPTELRAQFKQDTVDNFIHVAMRNADTLLATPDPKLEGKSPLQHFGRDLRAWAKLGPSSSDAELTKALTAIGSHSGGVRQISSAPAPLREYLAGHFRFTEDAYVPTPRQDARVIQPQIDAQQHKEATLYWTRKGTPRQTSLADLGTSKAEVARRLIYAGAPARPRKVELADGSVVDYQGAEDLIPPDSKVMIFRKGAQLTALGDLPGHGYILLEGEIRGERSADTGDGQFQSVVRNGPNEPAAVIGFTSSFNLGASARNANTYVESDTATVIAVPLTVETRRRYNGAVMAQSGEEVLETFGPRKLPPAHGLTSSLE